MIQTRRDLHAIPETAFEEYKTAAYIAALHVWPGLETGSMEVREGPAFASFDDFLLTVRGRGGHSAMPRLCIDPVKPAGELIGALQGIEYPGEGCLAPGAAILSYLLLSPGRPR
jgi:metal-dependent amidase/aminoacylase/carboxypeptidase family protein